MIVGMLVTLLTAQPPALNCGRAMALAVEPHRTQVAELELDQVRRIVHDGPGHSGPRGTAATEALEVRSRHLNRYAAAAVRLACEGTDQDLATLRILADNEGSLGQLSLILAALDDRGAQDRLRAHWVELKTCGRKTAWARRLVVLGMVDGLGLWFEGIRTSPSDGCVRWNLQYTSGLATLSAAAGYDYAGEFLALWAENPKLYGRLVTGMLLRGAKVPELKASCCTALRRVLAEAQNLAAEDQPEVDSKVLEERCAGDTP